MRLDIVILFSTIVHASGLIRLNSRGLNRLLTLASLPGKKLEKEVRRVFFEGQKKMLSNDIANKEFLELRELFSLRLVFSRVERGRLSVDVAIIAMLMTDGDRQMRYADAFEWDPEAKYWDDLLKILIEEMGTNRIYASMQRATVASIVELACQSHPNAASIIVDQCMDSQHWDIPGRWERVFGIMLNIKAIKQEIVESDKYDKELLGVVRRAKFADLLCEHILGYGFVAERNREFRELQITNEIRADELYMSLLHSIEGRRYGGNFSTRAKKIGESLERVISDLIAEGYWLCLEGSEFDECILELPEGHDVFRKICERYPSEMKGIDRSGLSIEVLRAMTLDRKLDELVKNLIKRFFRCANTSGLVELRDIWPMIEELFQELLKSGELKEDIKRGLKKAIKKCEYTSHLFTYFWDDLNVSGMSEELSRSGEFDEDVRFVLKAAIKNAKVDLLERSLRDLPNAKIILKELLCTVPRARELTRELLSTRRFNEVTRGCSKRPAEESSTCSLGSAGDSPKRARTSE